MAELNKTAQTVPEITPAEEAKKMHPNPAPRRREMRNQVRDAVRRYVADAHLVPPLSMEDLQYHAQQVVDAEEFEDGFRDFTMVLLSNEVWRETVASIPYERRIFLMPQCLRHSVECEADMDEFGLLCKECGRCPIGKLQAEAEDLGYMVLVAEGTTFVLKMLEHGNVDAVIGVSCLAALERSFPHTAAHAIPGMAIPLWMDGCSDTKVDVSWVREAITLASDGGWGARLDIDALREKVQTWFIREQLLAWLGNEETETERIGLEWIIKAGKRWRPFLVAGVYKALAGVEAPIPEIVQKLSVAVEYFHKASLVHDDIEDDDDTRYDEVTLHCEHGVPIALNIGDLLLGDGYRLIAQCGATPEQVSKLSAVAAAAHRKLCLGQGEELFGMQSPAPPSSQTVLNIFRWKTSPAFNVALQFGAIAAGCDEELLNVLEQFSDALGVAYQILDDLDDIEDTESQITMNKIRPSLLYSLAHEHADRATRDALQAAWRDTEAQNRLNGSIRKMIRESIAVEKAELLFEHYKNEAVRALNPLKNTHLKTLLRRIVGKILRGA